MVVVGEGETDERAANCDEEPEDLDENHSKERTGILLPWAHQAS